MNTIPFQRLFESAPGLPIVVSADFKIVAASNDYLRRAQQTKENLLDNVIFAVFRESPQDIAKNKSRYSHCNIARKPKMILLDIQMPKVDGLEVLKRIRSEEQTKNILVVVLTASKEQQDIVDVYQLNVNAYILKPVDFAGFTEAMKTMGMFWILLNQRPY
jgi:two-component system response regulator